MAKPQIPADWHPATYAVDELNKVVWKQGGYAVAMGLKGKHSTLIPGYEIRLCTTDELERMRRPAEPKAEADAKTIQKGFWGVALWLWSSSGPTASCCWQAPLASALLGACSNQAPSEE